MASTPHREPHDTPAWIEPMLAKSDDGRLPAGPHLSYEDKLDGYRCCARVGANGTVMLTSRNGLDFTDEFAPLVEPLAQIFEGRAGVLDGEIVAYDQHGRIDFLLLQQRRGRYQRRHRSVRADEPPDRVGEVDVRLLAFDLLRLGPTLLLDRPYDERRGLLAALPMPDPYRVTIVRAITYDQLRTDRLTPETLLQRTVDVGYEGVVRRCAVRPISRAGGRTPG